jgi:hypothetical protein
VITMLRTSSAECGSSVKQVRSLINEATHGRIRDLTVDDVGGLLVVRGHAPSHHLRQLALQAALDLLETNQFSAEITVG